MVSASLGDIAGVSWLKAGLFRSSLASPSRGGPACEGASPSITSQLVTYSTVSPAFALDALEFWETMEVVSTRGAQAPEEPAATSRTSWFDFLPCRAAGASYNSVMTVSPDGVDVEPLAAISVAQTRSQSPIAEWTGLNCFLEVAGDGVDFDLAAAH
mmetsp:Transcript_23957/g.61471  ORF Transcript_23957/g.61471 Transcript_23957/m.61471 type:complete len:157 (-) Transcript_23957:326-796(-)|eukprot:jgi/Tetstr1/422846/TSEL_013637.t1